MEESLKTFGGGKQWAWNERNYEATPLHFANESMPFRHDLFLQFIVDRHGIAERNSKRYKLKLECGMAHLPLGQ